MLFLAGHGSRFEIVEFFRDEGIVGRRGHPYWCDPCVEREHVRKHVPGSPDVAANHLPGRLAIERAGPKRKRP